jgi:long-chain acyl-CoA synthetase
VKDTIMGSEHGDPPATIGEVLEPALSACPDAEALVARSGRLTYRELNDAADRAAAALWAHGVRPGDRVAGCLPNDLSVVIAFHGTTRIGAVWVGVGEALTAYEQTDLIEHSGARVVLAGPNAKGQPPHCTVLDEAEWSAAQQTATPAPQVDVAPDDPAGIAYTSGTTGLPKGVVHSHRNLLLPGEVLAATRGWGRDLRKGDCQPLTILNMLVLTTLTTAQALGSCIIMDRRDARGIAEWIAAERVTVWNGAPAQLLDLAALPDADLSSLREVWSGGGDCSEALREAFTAAHHRPVCATYGLTEAPTVVAIDPSDGSHRPGASGQLLPHLEVVAIDDQGQPVDPGVVGELTITASSAGRWAGRWTPMLGSWTGKDIDPPPHALATGDLGTVTTDGWLSVVDRKKLVVVRGGANVYPAEVERILQMLPGVKRVAVFGVPDTRLGQRVAALIQASEPIDFEELRSACAERLARYKVPEQWGVVESLPVNAMGKIVRTQLVEILASASGQEN